MGSRQGAILVRAVVEFPKQVRGATTMTMTMTITTTMMTTMTTTMMITSYDHDYHHHDEEKASPSSPRAL